MSYSPASLALAAREASALVNELRSRKALREVALAERPSHAAMMQRQWSEAASLYLDLAKGWQALGDVVEAKLMANAYADAQQIAARFERWLEAEAVGR